MAESYTLSNIIDALTALQEMAEALSTSASRSDVELVIVKLCSPELASTVTSLKAKVERLEKTVAALSQGKVVSVSAPARQEQSAPKATPQNDEIPLPEAPPVDASAPASAPKGNPAVSGGDPVPVPKWPEIFETLKLS